MHPVRKLWIAVWGIMVMATFATLANYTSRPGIAGAVPPDWPVESTITRASGRQLLLFLHPHCPCSNATLSELQRLVRLLPSSKQLALVYYRPSNSSASWEADYLNSEISLFRHAEIVDDVAGIEASRFGATTSGHVVLVGADNSIEFSGGITAGRGHEGDNPAKSALVHILGTHSRWHGRTQFPVYGCSLLDPNTCCEDSPSLRECCVSQ